MMQSYDLLESSCSFRFVGTERQQGHEGASVARQASEVQMRGERTVILRVASEGQNDVLDVLLI
jgi:transcriptional antiterminator Rof (Rho-off)